MKKTILFDMDGTILNTLDDLMDSVNHCLAMRGFPERSLDEIRAFVGNGIEKLIERAVPKGTPPEELEACIEDMFAYYKEHSAIKTAPYEGVLDLFKELKRRGIKIAVVTNKAEDIARQLCEDVFLGLPDIVVGAREDLEPKPSPEGVFEAMRLLNARPQDCFFVGDSEVDIATAKNAGVKSIAVLWGFRGREVLENAGADFFAESINDLISLILT